MVWVDDINLAYPYEHFVEGGRLGDVIFFVTGNNGIFSKSTIDRLWNEIDGELILELPDITCVYTRYELNADHDIDGLMGVLHFPINGESIATYGFQNDLMVKVEINWFRRARNLSSFVEKEDGALVSMVIGYIDEIFDELQWWEIGTC